MANLLNTNSGGLIMTDEQIKQSAEEYASDKNYRTGNPSWWAQVDFIAGAHSRDDEIRQLHDVINELRNPWISINAKLPEVKKRVLFLCNNGKAYFGYNNIDNESATITNAPDGVKVTHWMPIPELKKGGEK